MRRVRLVIADRRPIVLQGFASLFAAQTDFEVVASCLDGASCLEAIRKLTPDVALVEDGFSDVTAAAMLAVINAEHLPTRLVLYTASVARGDLAAAIAAGACSAISMRERPQRVLQSLRLVATRPDQARVGTEENGALGENALAALTDPEREIMRLVAQGLSNQAIARRLNVSLSSIKVRLKHVFEKLEVSNRSELTALALSRRYGAIGVLAAVIFAALEDDHAAGQNAVDAGHVVTDTLKVMAADGTAEIVTISIHRPKESAGASGILAKVVTKARSAANAVAQTPITTSKLVDSTIDLSATAFTSGAANAPRPSAGTLGTFMMAAAAVWLYVIDSIHSVAKALDLSDSLADLSASAPANSANELALAFASRAAAGPDSHDNPASLNSSVHDWSPAFGTLRGDTAVFGDKIQMIDANAGDDITSGKDNSPQFANADTIGAGSVTVNALAGDTADRGDFSQTTAADASQHIEDNTTPSAGDDSDRSQSQRDLHASEHGLAAPGQQAEHHATTGSDGNPGHDPHASEEAPAAAKQHGRNDAPGGDSNDGQSQRDLHASEHGLAAPGQQAEDHATPGSDGNPAHDPHASGDGSAAAGQHAKHHTSPESDDNLGQSQRDLHAAPVNAPNNPHSEPSLNAGGKDQAVGDGSQAQTPAAVELGDSFHFKNEMATSKAPDVFELHAEHGPTSTEHDEHAARHDGLTSVHATDLTSLSLAEHNNFDHTKGAEHHLTHDLIV